jgi:hypothetical protein
MLRAVEDKNSGPNSDWFLSQNASNVFVDCSWRPLLASLLTTRRLAL